MARSSDLVQVDERAVRPVAVRECHHRDLALQGVEGVEDCGGPVMVRRSPTLDAICCSSTSAYCPSAIGMFRAAVEIA
eukprot:202997-Prorocentrum_minimum.AAC.3